MLLRCDKACTRPWVTAPLARSSRERCRLPRSGAGENHSYESRARGTMTQTGQDLVLKIQLSLAIVRWRQISKPGGKDLWPISRAAACAAPFVMKSTLTLCLQPIVIVAIASAIRAVRIMPDWQYRKPRY